jgi:Uma2 family endonuclease
MTTINPAVPFTPEDLLRLEGGDELFELVDGNLTEKKMSSLSGETAIIISSRLFSFISERRSGKLYSESTFRCFPEKPKQVRRPDIAFIATARLGQVPREGHILIAPDLAIEVVSPDDGVYELDEKLRDYKSAGIPLTWVINPQQRIVRVYEYGRLKAELEEHEELRGEPALPGFLMKFSELLPAPEPSSRADQ